MWKSKEPVGAVHERREGALKLSWPLSLCMSVVSVGGGVMDVIIGPINMNLCLDHLLRAAFRQR